MVNFLKNIYIYNFEILVIWLKIHNMHLVKCNFAKIYLVLDARKTYLCNHVAK